MPIRHATPTALCLLLAFGCVPAPTPAENDSTNAGRPRDGDPYDARGVPEGRGTGGRYALDPESSALYVVVRNDPTAFLSGFGSDHAVVAQGWTGTAIWSTSDPYGCRIHVVVPVGGLVVDPEGYRGKAGLEGDTSDRIRDEAQAVLAGPEVLDGDQWGTIQFDATRCVSTGDGLFAVTGELSFHGQTHVITVPMTVTAEGREIHAVGDLAFATSDWGMAPYTAVGGGIKHRDRIELHVDVRGRR